MLTAHFIFFVMCLKSHVMSRQRNLIAQTLTTVRADRHKDVTIADGNRPLWLFTHDNHFHNMGCIESFFQLCCHLKSMSTAKMMLYITGSVTSFFTSHQ